MIRFINIGKQYWNDDDYREEFSFIDTVVDKYVSVNDNQYWDCWDDFKEDYAIAGGWRGIDLQRFECLVDQKFFRPVVLLTKQSEE